jgi:phenylacetic acid degradation operon negative regulatory protein
MAAARPQDLIWTLYGEYLLHEAEPVWVGSLIVLLEALGVSAGHARTLLSRMTAKGWLEVERDGRRAYYALSARGRRLLEEGEARIYHPSRAAEWDGEWTLLAYSIPEDQRPQRDRLRVRLSWLGFGSLGNGLWLSPHDLRSRVREIGGELGVTAHLQLFRGAHAGLSSADSLVRQCWDLSAINVPYGSFIARHLRDYRKLTGKRNAVLSPREAYVRRFELVHEYRDFLLLDPFLPRPLQPEDWAGECAQALLERYRSLLSDAADEYLSSVVQRRSSVDRTAVH